MDIFYSPSINIKLSSRGERVGVVKGEGVKEAARQSCLICLNNVFLCLANIIPVIYPGRFCNRAVFIYSFPLPPPQLNVSIRPGSHERGKRNEAVMLAELAT